MSPRIPALVALMACAGPAERAVAQSRVPVNDQVAIPVSIRAAASAGRIHGVVRDQGGRRVSEASIIALGVVLTAVKSDTEGRFALELPPGEYILRAVREGYVSSYREPVRVRSSVRLERNITMLREDAALQAEDAPPDDHAHSVLAWRLRHLRRSVLRNESPVPVDGHAREGAGDRHATAASLLDAYARSATEFFLRTDFTGQVNWMKTASFDLSSGRPDRFMSGSVAYLAVGAPVGTHGEWAVRGALGAGEPSSWVMLGQYEANDAQPHAFTLGVSYGALRPGGTDRTARSLASREAWTAAAVYGFDRWRIRPGLEVDYGLRLDTYDYLASSHLLSPRVGVRATILPRTRLSADARRQMVAPGEVEFLPPSSSGLWLPPARTFSAFWRNGPLHAEEVRHLAIGIERDFGSRESVKTVRLVRFRQETRGQLATLFGLARSGDSHYVTVPTGHVTLEGWTIGVGGRLARHIDGSVDYSTGGAVWDRRPGRRSLDRVAPSAVRAGEERVHDVSASVRAEIPHTSTRVSLACRLNSGFSHALDSRAPSFDSRFDVEVRQQLPYQPIRGGHLEVLVGIRSLFRELPDAGSFFDELLTVAPPTRFVGGIQIRF